jgi:hypothetical protein
VPTASARSSANATVPQRVALAVCPGGSIVWLAETRADASQPASERVIQGRKLETTPFARRRSYACQTHGLPRLGRSDEFGHILQSACEG